MEAYFSIEGDQAIPTAHAAGPWDPTMLHGSAPTGLITYLAEQIPAPQPMRLVRLTIDLKRPVPIAPLTIRQWVTRQGRNIQTCTITLSAGDKDVVDAHILKISDRSLDLPDGVLPAVPPLPNPEAGIVEEGMKSAAGFNSTVDIVDAPWPEQGGGSPAAGPRHKRSWWFKIRRPMIEGAQTTPLMRAAASADYCNALGVPLDFKTWTYINADLTVHFARTPVGEWMMLDGDAMIGPDGRGLAHADLCDSQGYFGRAIQSLVIAPR